VIQVGDWLRRLQAIHEIDAPGHNKVMLKKPHTDEYLAAEVKVFGRRQDNKVQVLTMVDNEKYDDLLSASVVLCWLFNTAANNIVIECIARKTPLIINPLPAVVEYLGEDYPLYINSLEEADSLLADKDKIYAAHQYLLARTELAECLSYENFLHSVSSSDFYRNL
jgi:hypothetical protein